LLRGDHDQRRNEQGRAAVPPAPGALRRKRISAGNQSLNLGWGSEGAGPGEGPWGEAKVAAEARRSTR
jgi:hypothetical protein